MHQTKLMAAALALALTGTARAGDPTGSTASGPAGGARVLPFKLSGKTYVDVSYASNADDGAGTAAKSLGTDVKRFYVGIEYALNERISASFLTDIGDQDGKYDVFVKKAFVQARLLPALVLRAGSADNPWIPFVDDLYGFRYVENTLIDRTRFGNSADWGLHALGEVAGGELGYQVSIVNGHGYRNPSRAKWPTIEARVGTRLADHLAIGLGTSISTLGAAASVPHTGKRFDGLIAWDGARLRAGVEGFLAKNYTADEVSGAAPEDTARGLTVFASYQVTWLVALFGRLDLVQPIADTDGGVRDTYVNVGIETTPWKFLNLALVYKREEVDTGAAGFVFDTTNGKIGSMTPDASGTYQELGVFAQLVF